MRKVLATLCVVVFSIASKAQGINENILFANQFSNVQAAISSLPASGGTVFISPGTYPGPTSIPSNVSLIALSSPADHDMVESWGPNNTTINQARLIYSANLVLTDVENLYLKGIIVDFQNSGSGLVLTSSSYNRFEDVSIVNAGSPLTQTSPGQAALTINTSGSGASHNSVKNTFNNLNILCNQSANCYAGILLQGDATLQAFVTLNTFFSLTISGGINKAIDMEDNSDTNHFYDIEVNQDLASPPSSACVLCFNTTNASTDIDADGSSFENIEITGPFPYQIQAGVSYGNVISGNLTPSQVKPLSSKYPSFILTTSNTGPGTAAQQLLVGGHIGLSGPQGLGRNLDIAGSCALASGTCGQVNFNYPYTYPPTCVVSWQSSGPKGVLSSNMSTTHLTPTSSVSECQHRQRSS